MTLATPLRKRDRLRQFLSYHGSTPAGSQNFSASASAASTSQPNSLRTSTVAQRNFQDRVFLLLAQQDQDTIRQHAVPNATEIDAVLQQALIATRQKQATCQSKRWNFTFQGRTVILRDKADNIVKWLDRFKQVGDVASNADPVHIGLPWAGIRFLLEAAISEQSQMAALLLGLETALYLSNRLQIYMAYWTTLPTSPARVNFEACLVEFHALILRFLAGAIRIYQKSSISRGFEAFWRIEDVSSFEDECNKMANRAEIEASNCDRDLSAVDRAAAQQEQEDLQRVLKQLRDLHIIQSDISIISQGIGRKLDQSRDNQLLRTISHVGDAVHNSYENQRHRPCLPNTRVALLQEIIDWATSESTQYIYWLKGRAGTGKSTIALTIAQSLHHGGTMSASFFFKRGGGDLARSRKMVSTIVFQLAFQSALLGSFICDALREDPNLGDSASLSEQYHKLLLYPLQRIQGSVSGPFSCVVVLDALDECDDVADVRLFLRLLGNTQNMAGLGLRLLVTSRPEMPIRWEFQQIKHIAYQDLALHDVPRAIVDEDIQKFVAHELALIRAERGLPDTWPGDDKIQIVTTHADGLFIYAATVCRFVNGPRQVQASDRLEQICQGTGAQHKSTKALDEMYLMILDSSMKGDFSAEEAEEVITRLRHLIGGVVLLFDILSAEELERLLLPSMSTSGTLVQDTLDPLHAILDMSEDRTKPVQMQHLSFRDFLVDYARCPDTRFHIDERDGHRKLSTHCLDLMTRYLRQNICRLPGPGTLISELSETTLKQYVPPGLRYACRHWIDHVEHGVVNLRDDGRVYGFLSCYSHYWLEVMMLVGKVPEAIGILRKLENLIEEKKSPKLHSLVRDTLRFIYSFSHILTQAPLQLYSAGLFFSPSDSIFRQSFTSQRYGEVEVRTQLLSNWSQCFHTLEGHSGWVNSVVFSPNGSRVASGSYDQTVRVWDVQTGECQYTLKGHSDEVWSLVFSPDGSRLASGSDDKTVRVWDVQTGDCQHTLEGHSNSVNSVVFSPNGSRVASGSYDNTVRVWDVQTGKCQHTLKGHSGDINNVVFSPSGSQVASSSGDKTVRVWDVETGQCQHTLKGHSGDIHSVVFSPSGSRVASGSWDGTVRVWDVQIGECQHAFEGHSNSVYSVVFSPNRSRVASGSNDKTVRVWNAQTGECQRTLEGHSGSVYSVVFSPDGSLIASGSEDSTVRVWDVQTGECQHTLEGHSGSVRSVVFSPNGSRVASAGGDKMVRVWNTQTGECQQTLEGHSGWVYSVVFSPNGSRLASGSWDSTVRVWDAQTGECQHTLQGHPGPVYSVVFSPDGSLIASGSEDKTVWVWDIATMMELLCHGTDTVNNEIEFSADSTKILINGESVFIPLRIPLPSATTELERPNLDSRGWLTVKGEWVILSSERILWLPPEYRPRSRVSYRDVVVLGSGAGRVTFVRRVTDSSFQGEK